PHGLRLRRQVWEFIEPVWSPGARGLDTGCGTGEDALYLSARGIFVHALDKSPRMIDAAQRKLDGRTLNPVTLEAADLEHSSSPPEMWDGILADFGVLNCVGQLGRVAECWSRLIKPSGSIVLCVMGRCAPAEWIAYMLLG